MATGQHMALAARQKRQEILDYLHKAKHPLSTKELAKLTKEPHRAANARLTRMTEIKEVKRTQRLIKGNYIFYYEALVETTMETLPPGKHRLEMKAVQRATKVKKEKREEEEDLGAPPLPRELCDKYITGGDGITRLVHRSDKSAPLPNQGGQGRITGPRCASILNEL